MIAASVLVGCLISHAASPSKKTLAAIRLSSPWNKLSDLSDEQKSQLDKIHRKSREEIKAIEQQAKADMMAVLTPQQQAELREMEDQTVADKKLKAGEKDRADATTLPAEDR